MKLMILFVALAALVWLIRAASRRRNLPPAQDSSRPAAKAQPMLACAVCGVHMPRDEVLPGRGGVFCSEAHRTAFEKTNPGP